MSYSEGQEKQIWASTWERLYTYILMSSSDLTASLEWWVLSRGKKSRLIDQYCLNSGEWTIIFHHISSESRIMIAYNDHLMIWIIFIDIRYMWSLIPWIQIKDVRSFSMLLTGDSSESASGLQTGQFHSKIAQKPPPSRRTEFLWLVYAKS